MKIKQPDAVAGMHAQFHFPAFCSFLAGFFAAFFTAFFAAGSLLFNTPQYPQYARQRTAAQPLCLKNANAHCSEAAVNLIQSFSPDDFHSR